MNKGFTVDQARQMTGYTKPDPQVAAPPRDVVDTVSQMPNSEKLSPTENWLYKKLPGFSQSTVGKALQSFSESPAGKALQVLDIGAEGLERTFGLMAQYIDRNPNEDFNLKDAWAAGSLFWDSVNLPRLKYNDQGNIVGLQMDSNLPGTYALTEARKMLGQGATMEEVRTKYYQNLGALALRSQLNDTWGHVIADPLNWILGAAKPIEKLHAIRNLALTGKVDVEVVQELERGARAAGQLEDAAKYAEVIAKAQENGKAITKFDKFAIALTGGTPYLQDVTKMNKAGQWFSKLNPFALTPQARASEMLDMVASNVGEYLIRPNWGNDPIEFADAVSRAAKGSINGDFSMFATTVQGRTVQGFLSQSEATIKTMAQEWKAFSGERSMIQRFTSIMPGMDELSIRKLIIQDPEAFFQKVSQAAADAGDQVLMKSFQEGAITQDTIKSLGEVSEAALHPEVFYAQSLIEIQDAAMKQAIVQFGIKEKGIVTKWSDALKAWESIPFIKANPANMVRNIVNNEITLIGRGLYGTMLDSAVRNFWKGKWIPPQFERDFGFGAKELQMAEGISFDLVDKAGSRLTDALTGKETLADKIKMAAGKVSLGPGDKISEFSQAMERSASRRASTVGWLEFHEKYWNPTTGFTSVSKHLDPAIADKLEQVAPGLSKVLDDVAQASGADSKKFAELMQSSIEHNVTTIFKNAEDKLGYKFDDVLTPEITSVIRDGLPKAIEDGKVREFMDGLRLQMEQNVDEMFNRHVENLPGIVQAQVQAGGPMQYHRIFGKAMDEFWGGNLEHSVRMSTLNEALDYAKQSGDWSKVDSMWNKVLSDGENHFNRVWKKFDAYQEGLRKGAESAGIPYPKEVTSAFGEMRDGWKSFFEYRNKTYKEFFAERVAGKQHTKELENIQQTLDTMYEKLTAKEDSAFQRIDDLMSQSLDPAQGKMYMNYRDQAANLRLEDRKATQDFFKKIRQLPKDEARDAYAQYWQDKMGRIDAIRSLDARGSAAIQGDVESAKLFQTAETAQATTEPKNIYELAHQYGIPSATNTGNRNDRRILSTVNKYVKDTSASDVNIVKAATLPEEVKTTYESLDNARNALKEVQKADYADVFTHSAEIQKAKDAVKEAKAAYDKALEANKIDAKAIAKLTESKQFMNVKDIPIDIAKQAFEARATEKATQSTSAATKAFIPDAEMIFKDPMPIETGLSELNYGRSYAAMDSITDGALEQTSKQSRLLKDLPDDVKKAVSHWQTQVEQEMSGFRSAGVQYAAFRRDSALLNYNRRTNFDNLVGHMAPFAFWTTHSIANWAIYSLDRPSMVANYLRTRKLFETAGLPGQNLPSRMKGQIRVKLPFTPDWMGDTFVDPLRFMLPFDGFMQPWENAQNSKFQLQNKTEQTLQTMVENGEISQQEFDDAMSQQSGGAWDMAQSRAKEGGDNYDAMDFVSMTMTPHAPLMWAYNAATGQKNDIGPFTPMSRTIKNFATMAGVDDWSNSPYNLEGKLRKMMGLPAYDKWDNYRVGREISNLAGDGKYSMDAIQNAMQTAALVEAGQMDSAEAVKTDKVYAEAVKRSNQEFAGGWAGAIGSLLGIPVKAYPTGEEKQRELGNQFNAAYEKYNNGDVKALSDFFNDHPEYESRLALFKSPEERLKNFMVDNVWTKWNSLPKVTQDEIKTQMGDSFSNNFINKETRNYDSISPLQLQVWLKLIGGKQVGKLDATAEALSEFNQLKLTKPETAWRVQTFYDMRKTQFPNWFDKQEKYYSLSTTQRKVYLSKNPDLKEYWTARQKWMEKNPDLVRFLTDDEKQIAKYEKMTRQEGVSVPTSQEIQSRLSPEMKQLMSSGQSLPPAMNQYFETLASEYGISRQQLLQIMTGTAQP